MVGRPAARVGDMTAHGTGLSKTGPGSPDVFIGKKRAWRGLTPTILLNFVDIVRDTVTDLSDKETMKLQNKPMYDQLLKQEEKDIESSAMVDFHRCPNQKVPPAPPDLMGAVINGSTTVFINKLAACRQGDTIQEVAITNNITKGSRDVMIGG